MEQLEAAVLSSDYEGIEKYSKKLHKKKIISHRKTRPVLQQALIFRSI